MQAKNLFPILLALVLVVLYFVFIQEEKPPVPVPVGCEITTASRLPQGTMGQDYSTTLAAKCDPTPLKWSAPPGDLPPGLSLNEDGEISGKPQAAAAGRTFSFEVTVTNSASPAQSDTEGFRIVIEPEDVCTITPQSLPNGTVNQRYPPQTLRTTDCTEPLTWTVSAGALPPGLTLNRQTGVIGGTPTADGTFNFTVRVTDSANPAQSDTEGFRIVIGPEDGCTITTTSPLPPGTVGQAYGPVTLRADCGAGQLNWEVTAGALPPGLALSPQGVISQTPNRADTFNFTIKVTNNANPQQTATKGLQITVTEDGCEITTTSPLSPGTVGQAYGPVTLRADCGAGQLNWEVTAGALPPGLALSPQGVISQTPNPADTFNFTVKVTNNANPQRTATKGLQITVEPVVVRTILINGRDDGGLRWTFKIGNQATQDGGGGSVANITGVNPGDIIEWRSEEGTHGVTFRQFSAEDVQGFLSLDGALEAKPTSDLGAPFGPDARGTDSVDADAPPSVLLLRATVREGGPPRITFTCTFHGPGIMNGSLAK